MIFENRNPHVNEPAQIHAVQIHAVQGTTVILLNGLFQKIIASRN